MAHEAQQRFCIKVKSLFPSFFRGVTVLDIGSQDINGSIRYLFRDCTYMGIDLAPGKGVDHVVPGNTLAAPDDCFDTIVSCEAFEHDETWKDTIENAIRMLKPGGLFMWTCAGPGRPEHGTRATTPNCSPFTPDYYMNIDAEMVMEIPGYMDYFQYFWFERNNKSHDTYFFGIKRDPGKPFPFWRMDISRLCYIRDYMKFTQQKWALDIKNKLPWKKF